MLLSWQKIRYYGTTKLIMQQIYALTHKCVLFLATISSINKTIHAGAIGSNPLQRVAIWNALLINLMFTL